MDLHGKNIIAGEASSEGSDRFRATDPSSGREIGPHVHEATDGEIDRAMQAAESAFEAYRKLPPERVAAFLEAVADEILNQGEELLACANAESGLPLPRLTGERSRTTNTLKLFAGVIREGSWVEARIDHALPDRKPLPKPDLRRMLVPIGPVAVFGASNFPLAFSVAGGDTASALAAGNPVVVKAHPAHPGTSERVARAVHAAAASTKIPPGILSLVHGRGERTGLSLVRHPLAQAVGFTGSLKGGRALFDAAAARPRPIPVFAEMGSVNPVFILPDAMKTRVAEIAQGFVGSLTLGVGQFCTNPGIVVGLKGAPLDDFTGRVGRLVWESAPGTMLHAGIRARYEAGTASMGATEGVRCVARSSKPPDPAKTEVAPAFFATGAEAFLARPALQEEVFGPSGLLVACGSGEDLLRVAKAMEGQLTATIHATPKDLEEFKALVGVLVTKVGRLVCNGYPTGVEVCPSMQHGGPYPAATDARSTSVGTAAISRFARPVCYQEFPRELLPPELQDSNPRKIGRLVDGAWTR